MNCIIQSEAEADILAQIEWYADNASLAVAARFRDAVIEALKQVANAPFRGAPKHLPNPALAGLRSWQIKSFPEFLIYYLADEEKVTILRILHSKRDTGAILSP